ncbi:lasso peptide biosynthesis protein [Nocardia colli]|uniref:lasso peptide biosynthesis protein n=1 Tax=Nocardia colli TaxID=2545717 RepID=UPI00168D849A|nr:lasso peptide biosynthesis protein [Nocardia colli]
MDWEYFLTDLDPATNPPRIPLRLRQYAVARTFRALWIYRRYGWVPAQRYLQKLPGGPGAAIQTILPAATAIRLARREVLTSQLVLRVVIPNGLCLPRSFALATYLSALGLPAEVTIARPLTRVTPKDDFHSWTELYGVVINDEPDVQLGYRVLHRVTGLRGEPRSSR